MMRLYRLPRILRLIFWSLALFFFILTGSILYLRSQPGVQSPLTAYEYYQQGKKLVTAHKFTQAKSVLLKALALNPCEYKALMDLGYVYSLEGDFIYSNHYFERALKCVGSDTDNLQRTTYNLGHNYLSERDIERSWNFLHRAHQMKNSLAAQQWPDDPSDPVYWVAKNDKAKYTAAVQSDIDEHTVPKAIIQRDSKLRKWSMFRQYQRILEDCQQYRQLNPASRYIQLFLRWEILATIGLKDYDRARVYIKEIGQYKLRTEDAFWVMGRVYDIYLYTKDYANAVKTLNDMLDQYPKLTTGVWVKNELAQIYNKTGELNKEEQTYEQISERYSKSKYVYFARQRLVEINAAKGNYEKAYLYLKKALSPSVLALAAVGILIQAGFWTFLLFIFSRLFFIKKLEEIKLSRFRLPHVWIVYSIFAFLQILSLLTVFLCNHLAGGFLGRFHLDPFIVGAIAGEVGVACVCLWWLRSFYRWDDQHIGFIPKKIMISVLMPFIIALGLVLISVLWNMFLLQGVGLHFVPKHPMGDFIKDIGSHGYMVQRILTVVLLVGAVPLCEEIFFRVFLFNIIKQYTNTFWGVFLAASVFAVVHHMPLIIPYYFVVGVVLNILYIKTKSIYPSMMAHAFLNLIFVLLSFRLG